MKKLFVLFFAVVFLAVACNQKQAVKDTPKPISENQNVNTSVPATTIVPMYTTGDNSAALKQAQRDANNAKIAQQQAEAKAAQLEAEQKAAQDALSAKTLTDTEATTCTATKAKLAQLTTKLNLITQETSSIYSDYRDDGYASRQDFGYSYNKMLAMSSGYYSKISQLQTDTISLNTVLTISDLDDVQLNLNNGGNTFRQAFDLKMQTFKYASMYPTDANIENAKAALSDAGVKERAAVTYFFQATSNMDALKKAYSDELAKDACP